MKYDTCGKNEDGLYWAIVKTPLGDEDRYEWYGYAGKDIFLLKDHPNKRIKDYEPNDDKELIAMVEQVMKELR